MLKYQEGDLFENIKGKSRIVIPHVCNDVGAWGSGFVVPLGKAFPKSRQYYLDWYKMKGQLKSEDYQGQNSVGNFELGQTQFVPVDTEHEITVANMIAQHDIGGDRPLRYNALAKCMDQVAAWMPDWAIDPHYEIHAPLFGSGLAGGNFLFIQELIEDCWVRRDINVTIHFLPGTLPEGFI
jgi:hypothetical protein